MISGGTTHDGGPDGIQQGNGDKRGESGEVVGMKSGENAPHGGVQKGRRQKKATSVAVGLT